MSITLSMLAGVGVCLCVCASQACVFLGRDFWDSLHVANIYIQCLHMCVLDVIATFATERQQEEL